MKPHKIIAFAAWMVVAASTAQGSHVSVYFAPDATDCDANIAIHTPVTWYILADLYGDAASDGLSGVEFSQRGTPPGWLMSWAPNPAANVSLIHPDGIDVGANIAFPICQTGGSGSLVLLYTATGFSLSQVGPTCLWIDAHQFPSNPNLACVRVVLCNGPVFSSICVAGLTAVINGNCELPPCNVGVQPAPWTKIKELYR